MQAVILPTQFTQKTLQIFAAGGAAILAAGSLFVAYFDPTQVHFFPVCPLYTLTGFACPGCGLTRGFHSLFHGDIAGAVHFNALIPLWVVALAFLFVSLIWFAVSGRTFSFRKPSPNWMFVLLGVMLIFGVLRNIPSYPFNLLYP